MSRKSSPRKREGAAVTANLGKTIQRLRNAYQLSLSDLSEQSGVAKSIISQIEKNETNPTVGTVWRLSNALGVSLEDVFRGNDEPALVEQLGPSGTPVLQSEDGLIELTILGWIETVDTVQWYDVRAAPGGVLESEAHPPGSIENLSVLEGVLEVRVGTERWTLNAGDTVRYRADRPHQITNCGSATARATMVNLRLASEGGDHPPYIEG